MIITGAGGGIGAASARMAASHGYSVSLMGRAASLPAVRELAESIKANGGQAYAVAADVTRQDEIEDAFERAADRFGTPTVLVNAAGITLNSAVRDLDQDSVARVLSVNVLGLMLCCRAAIRHMSQASGEVKGSIINISSMAATIGGRPGASVYAASKGAVDVFTTGIAREVAAQGIRVNSIRPGVIATNMTAHLENNPELKQSVEASIPMGRIGRPEEIAEIVLWLASSAASFVTGAHVNAGGGGFQVASRMVGEE